MANPSTYPNAVLWLPTTPSLIWTGAVGSSANVSAIDDTIQNAETQISGRVFTQATANIRPKWKGNGWYECISDSGNNRRIQISSTTVCDHFHVNGTGHLLTRFKMNSKGGGVFKTLSSNCRITNLSKGYGLRISDVGVTFTVWTGGAAAILTLVAPASQLTAGVDHRCEVIVKVGDNQSSIKIDDNAAVTGTIGTLGTSGSTDFLLIGTRGNGIETFDGQIKNFFVASQEMSSEYVTAWKNYAEPSQSGRKFTLGLPNLGL